jgi:hypothetical protein
MPAYAAVAFLACRPSLAESLRAAFARHVGHTLLSFERPAAPAPPGCLCGLRVLAGP